MSNSIYQSILDVIRFVLDLVKTLSLPLAVIVGAAIVAYAVRGSILGREGNDLTKSFGRIFAYFVAGLFVVCGWAGLRELESSTASAIYAEQSKELTKDPVVDAPMIEQPGPVFAAMVEKTYTRTLTLPPEFFERVGAEGVGALSPYLVDPTAENVKAMVDSFRRSGQDVVFSRELTRSDESPMPFDSAVVNVAFERIGRQAYRALFNAEYRFTNEGGAPMQGRFMFYPPMGGGTIQSLKVLVDGQAVTEPDERGGFAWTGQLDPGKSYLATVSYDSVGTGEWTYEVGSLRRRVRDFRLTAKTQGPVEFRTGTINPSSRGDGVVEWRLNDVITQQRIGLVFPEDIAARDAFLDGVGFLPAGYLVMMAVLIAIGLRTGRPMSPKRLALVATTGAIGFAASSVLHGLVGYTPALVVGSLFAAATAAAATQWRSLPVLVPVCLLPVSLMAQESADTWMLGLAVASVALLTSPLYSRNKRDER